MSKAITSFFSPTKTSKKKDAADAEVKSEQEQKKQTSKKRKTKVQDEEQEVEESLPVKKSKASGDEKSIDWDHLETCIHPSWQKHLSAEFKKPYWSKLKANLKKEIDAGVEVFPPAHLIFRALEICPFDEVKAVIIGQDPYHDNGQAEGLCFSVPKGVTVPSSLRNIYKELASDIKGFVPPKHGHLLKWAEQGVLLLNITLTVKAHSANSHKSFGWSNFTDAVVNALNRDREGLVFLLWGAHAQNKAKSIDKEKHHALMAAHPSGLSANKGFYGCKHFSKCNEYLQQHGKAPIDWTL